MQYTKLSSTDQQQIADLFKTVFSVSEGEVEGALIGELALELSQAIDDQQVQCFASYQQDVLTGVIFFTCLRFKSEINVYLLGPVAVSTEHQGQGIGQSLIINGLRTLKQQSVEVVITYGDPKFYAKVGFQPLSERQIQAPLTLSMPHGWQAQSLTDQAIPTIDGRPSCVKAFNNPIYW